MFAITIIDIDAKLHLITSKDPLERALMGHDIFGNANAHKIVQTLDVAVIHFHNGSFEPLNRHYRYPPKPSI